MKKRDLIILLGCVILPFAQLTAKRAEKVIAPIKIISPADGAVTENFLSAVLKWHYARANEDTPYHNVHLIISTQSDLSRPFIDVTLKDQHREFRFATLPETTYYWQLTPMDPDCKVIGPITQAQFTTGKIINDYNAPDSVRYKNPRRGSHWLFRDYQPFEQYEPLSPWYAKKSYFDSFPPSFDNLKDRLPVPVLDGRPEVLDTYWYCWKTLTDVWYFPPDEEDHQAVSTICGFKGWGHWGSTMVWDTAFMMYFARFGHQAYPFIQCFDNCYARQHENGFICRETDKNNREVYVIFPLNPPLFAWTEWEYYMISGDTERLRRVFMPIVKHYEWWMRYQRRENGLYWTHGHNEADDSPRNSYMHYAASATSYQAMAALYLSKMARTIGRMDMVEFFDDQHRQLGDIVNRYFWDEQHQIYNDLTEDHQFITEMKPGVFCKHCHIFWPLPAEIAPQQRFDAVVKEMFNPDSFFRRNGIASLSADSKGYNPPTGQYWRGAVWPPIQCMVQCGLRNNGRYDLARAAAKRYFNAVIETYQQSHDITENLAPDIPKAHGCGKFVGWGGIAPVANLIEYVLGFEINVPDKKITWNIDLLERHGIENLKLANNTIDLICQKRENPDEPCRINVSSDGDFKLIVNIPQKMNTIFDITKGDRELIIDGKN